MSTEALQTTQTTNYILNETTQLYPTDNQSDTYLYGLDKEGYNYILYAMCVLSSLTVAINLVILMASKFAKAGKSATMVFIRSLCISDMLVGLFGILKTIMLLSLNGRIINCFLPESVFLSSTTIMCFTLLWMNIDSYLRLVHPLHYAGKMDKANIVIMMMILWNGSFIIGFLPLMGWSTDQFVCNFFYFYKPIYVATVSCVWIVSIVACTVMQVLLRNVLKSIKQNSSFVPASSKEFKKHSQLVIIIRIDLILWIICYIPCVLYIIISFHLYQSNDMRKVNSNLLFFLPVFLLRSFICAFIHSYKTIQIQKLLHEVTNTAGKRIIQRDSSNESSDAITSFSDQSWGRKCSCCSGKRHGLPGGQNNKQCLCASPSTITVIQEEEGTTITESLSSATIPEHTTKF